MHQLPLLVSQSMYVRFIEREKNPAGTIMSFLMQKVGAARQIRRGSTGNTAKHVVILRILANVEPQTSVVASRCIYSGF
jgi:hypothetical protein